MGHGRIYDRSKTTWLVQWNCVKGQAAQSGPSPSTWRCNRVMQSCGKCLRRGRVWGPQTSVRALYFRGCAFSACGEPVELSESRHLGGSGAQRASGCIACPLHRAERSPTIARLSGPVHRSIRGAIAGCGEQVELSDRRQLRICRHPSIAQFGVRSRSDRRQWRGHPHWVAVHVSQLRGARPAAIDRTDRTDRRSVPRDASAGSTVRRGFPGTRRVAAVRWARARVERTCSAARSHLGRFALSLPSS